MQVSEAFAADWFRLDVFASEKGFFAVNEVSYPSHIGGFASADGCSYCAGDATRQLLRAVYILKQCASILSPPHRPSASPLSSPSLVLSPPALPQAALLPSPKQPSCPPPSSILSSTRLLHTSASTHLLAHSLLARRLERLHACRARRYELVNASLILAPLLAKIGVDPYDFLSDADYATLRHAPAATYEASAWQWSGRAPPPLPPPQPKAAPRPSTAHDGAVGRWQDVLVALLAGALMLCVPSAPDATYSFHSRRRPPRSSGRAGRELPSLCPPASPSGHASCRTLACRCVFSADAFFLGPFGASRAPAPRYERLPRAGGGGEASGGKALGGEAPGARVLPTTARADASDVPFASLLSTEPPGAAHASAHHGADEKARLRIGSDRLPLLDNARFLCQVRSDRIGRLWMAS